MKYETIAEIIKTLFLIVVSSTFFVGALNSITDEEMSLKDNFNVMYITFGIISALACVVYAVELFGILF